MKRQRILHAINKETSWRRGWEERKPHQCNVSNRSQRRYCFKPHRLQSASLITPCIVSWIHCLQTFHQTVPAGSPSRGGDVAVYVSDINQPSLPTPFYSVLVSVSVFMALSNVFHFINSPDNSPFSHSVLLVLSLPYWSFQLYVSFVKVSFSPDTIRTG